mmetsp:Transcript_13448/g.25309  ORF Transcript_13448/g.25309 Transcript_13448/m.25309 type:complete len:238 (-) Transcript_13448:2480-3193(-)
MSNSKPPLSMISYSSDLDPSATVKTPDNNSLLLLLRLGADLFDSAWQNPGISSNGPKVEEDESESTWLSPSPRSLPVSKSAAWSFTALSNSRRTCSLNCLLTGRGLPDQVPELNPSALGWSSSIVIKSVLAETSADLTGASVIKSFTFMFSFDFLKTPYLRLRLNRAFISITEENAQSCLCRTGLFTELSNLSLPKKPVFRLCKVRRRFWGEELYRICHLNFPLERFALEGSPITSW